MKRSATKSRKSTKPTKKTEAADETPAPGFAISTTIATAERARKRVEASRKAAINKVIFRFSD